jgi:hypothetical protein
MVRNGCNRIRERGRLDGLRRMHLESRRQRPLTIFGARVTCQRDRGKKASMFGLMPPNLPNQRVPVLT